MKFTGKADKPLPNKTKDYIKDAIFQTIVLQEVYPNAIIDTYLCMPDKSVIASIEGLPSLFSVSSTEPKTPGGFRKIEVYITDEKAVNAILDKIKDEELLGLLNLNDRVKAFKVDVITETEQFINLLNSDFNDYRPLLNKECKKCEFRGNQINTKDGFKECWGAMAEINPHIFDLYYGGDLGEKQLLNEKISNKTVSLWDIKESELVKKDNTIGTRNERQLIQYEHTKFSTEWPNDEMDQKVFSSNFKNQFKYPLHFIDFETMSSALPFHKGLTPYDMFPFQWSVHTIKHEGAKPDQQEFINTEEGYPGFRFAETLMDCIGESGTPLMWSHHENTTLKKVLKHMSILGYQNENLKTWLLGITKDDDENRSGRLVDMNDFTLKNYFHPDMEGRTSIKVTLPAIWNNNPYLHQIPWFSEWVLKDENGKILDPYLKLKNLKELWGFESSETENDEVENSEWGYDVKDGGAAMKAYQDMTFTNDKSKKEKLKMQLLKYCQLDTLAMVIIFEHWKAIAQKKSLNSENQNSNYMEEITNITTRQKIQFVVTDNLPEAIISIFKTYNRNVELGDNLISIPETARQVIKELHKENKIHRDIQSLTNLDKCKKNFHLSFPMLATIGNIVAGRYIMNRNYILNISNIDYHITNDWYDRRSHLQYLYDWCIKLYK